LTTHETNGYAIAKRTAMFKMKTAGIQKYSIEDTVDQRMYGNGIPQTADAGPSA